MNYQYFQLKAFSVTFYRHIIVFAQVLPNRIISKSTNIKENNTPNIKCSSINTIFMCLLRYVISIIQYLKNNYLVERYSITVFIKETGNLQQKIFYPQNVYDSAVELTREFIAVNAMELLNSPKSFRFSTRKIFMSFKPTYHQQKDCQCQQHKNFKI